MSYPNLTV